MRAAILLFFVLFSTIAKAQESQPTTPIESLCGNKVIEQGEACDDGNHQSFDGCQRDCTLPRHLPLLVTGVSTLSMGLVLTLGGLRLSGSSNGFDAGISFFLLSGGVILDVASLVPLTIYTIKKNRQKTP